MRRDESDLHRWGIPADGETKEFIVYEVEVPKGLSVPTSSDEAASEVAPVILGVTEIVQVTYLGTLSRVGATAILAQTVIHG